jgi:hypothetical protein
MPLRVYFCLVAAIHYLEAALSLGSPVDLAMVAWELHAELPDGDAGGYSAGWDLTRRVARGMSFVRRKRKGSLRTGNVPRRCLVVDTSLR